MGHVDHGWVYTLTHDRCLYSAYIEVSIRMIGTWKQIEQFRLTGSIYTTEWLYFPTGLQLLLNIQWIWRYTCGLWNSVQCTKENGAMVLSLPAKHVVMGHACWIVDHHLRGSKCRVKWCHTIYRRQDARLPSLSHWARRRYTTESVTHGQWDARPTVTFPAAAQPVPLGLLVFRPAEGSRLSWPEWLVKYQDDVPAVTHPSTNRDRRTATSVDATNAANTRPSRGRI